MWHDDKGLVRRHLSHLYLASVHAIQVLWPIHPSNPHTHTLPHTHTVEDTQIQTLTAWSSISWDKENCAIRKGHHGNFSTSRNLLPQNLYPINPLSWDGGMSPPPPNSTLNFHQFRPTSATLSDRSEWRDSVYLMFACCKSILDMCLQLLTSSHQWIWVYDWQTEFCVHSLTVEYRLGMFPIKRLSGLTEKVFSNYWGLMEGFWSKLLMQCSNPMHTP